MAASKVTFTLDQATLARLKDASVRLAKPKSQIVREAILDFYDRLGRLSERERARMLRVFDEYVAAIPDQGANAVDRGISEIPRARKASGRRGRRRATA